MVSESKGHPAKSSRETVRQAAAELEHQVLVLRAGESSRRGVIEQVSASIESGGAGAGCIVLEAPFGTDDHGWDTRTTELLDACDESGMLSAAAEVLTRKRESRGSLQERFADALAYVLDSSDEAAHPLIVFAPLWVEDHQKWAKGLSTLSSKKELESGRFVVVTVDDESVETLREELDEKAIFVDARPESEVRREAAESDSQDIQHLVASAAEAVQRNDSDQAVFLQRKARDLCLKLGLVAETVLMELVLAAYLIRGRSLAITLAVYRGARRHAEDEGLNELAVQAQIASGAALDGDGRYADAAAAYEEAGELAEERGLTLTAIDAYVRCGKAHLADDDEKRAAESWSRGIAVARKAPIDEVQLSNAYEAATTLAGLCRRRGQRKLADSLREQIADLAVLEKMRAEVTRKAEAARQAARERRAEEARRAEAKRQAEEELEAEQTRKDEEIREAAEKRLAREKQLADDTPLEDDSPTEKSARTIEATPWESVEEELEPTIKLPDAKGDTKVLSIELPADQSVASFHGRGGDTIALPVDDPAESDADLVTSQYVKEEKKATTRRKTPSIEVDEDETIIDPRPLGERKGRSKKS